MKTHHKIRIREDHSCIDCGNSFNVLRDNVKRNGFYRCVNCGRKSASEKRKGSPIKHGDAIKSSPFYKLYNVYNSMLYRCNSNHKDYGGRGISVCREVCHQAIKWSPETPLDISLALQKKRFAKYNDPAVLSPIKPVNLSLDESL